MNSSLARGSSSLEIKDRSDELHETTSQTSGLTGESPYNAQRPPSSQFSSGITTSGTESNPEFPSLVRASKKQSLNKLTVDLTLNKIRIPANQLYGRENEIQSIRDFIREASEKQNKGVVIISGESGVGKSALARHIALREKLAKSKQTPGVNAASIAVCCGSFAESRQNDPYSAIIEVIAELCGIILRKEGGAKTVSGEDERESATIRKTQFGQKLMETLRPEELKTLSSVLPILDDIIGQPQEHIDEARGVVSDERKNLLLEAMARLVQIAAKESGFESLLWVLDDIHWADASSLELMYYILRSNDISNLWIVGTSRPEGLSKPEDDPTPLTELLSRIKSQNIACHTHELQTLTVSHIHMLLEDVLRTDESDVVELAKLCHRKTNGNAFFLIRYLHLLEEKGLLNFNMGTFKWFWDASEIETKTQSTGNVVAMVKNSIERLPKNVRVVLQLASCLGPTFKASTLQLLWDAVIGNENDFQLSSLSFELPAAEESTLDLEKLQQIAIDQGFLLRREHTHELNEIKTLIWVHAKVLEAVHGLFVTERQKKLCSDVGRILLKHFSKEDLENNIFLVVNLLNEGFLGDGDDVIEKSQVVHLNLQALEKAISMASFLSAFDCAEKALGHLETIDARWNSDLRNTTLTIYTHAASVACTTGKLDIAETRCAEILKQEHLGIEEKAPAYLVLAQILYMSKRLPEAKKLCLKVLAQLGCYFPKAKSYQLLAGAAGLLRLKLTAKARTIEEANSLKTVTDAKTLYIFQILDRLIPVCYMMQDPMLLMVTLRAYRLTLRYGISPVASNNFASIALLMAAFLDDFATARTFGNYSLALMDKSAEINNVAKVYIVVYAGVLHFVSPLRSTMKPLQDGYEMGMSCGDFSRAMHCLELSVQMALASGCRLAQIQADCRLFLHHMKQFGQRMVEEGLSSLQEMVHRLMGLDQETENFCVNLTSNDALDDEGSSEEKSHAVQKAYRQLFTMQSAVWFGDFEEALKLADATKPITKSVPACCLAYMDHLSRALVHFEKCRQLSKGSRHLYKRHLKEGKNLLKRVKRWAERGNPNVLHHEALMEAELASLNEKTHSVAKLHYTKAILLATRHGFVQDAALANERLGEFLLATGSETDEIVYHLEEAIKLYREWGADAKAEHVLQTHPDMFKVPETIVAVETP